MKVLVAFGCAVLLAVGCGDNKPGARPGDGSADGAHAGTTGMHGDGAAGAGGNQLDGGAGTGGTAQGGTGGGTAGSGGSVDGGGTTDGGGTADGKAGAGGSAGAGGAGGNGTVATLVSVGVTPAVATIAANTTLDFTATALLSDGTTSDVTATATWVSSAPAVATVAGHTASGVAAGVTTISASIMGTNGALTGQATLTVTAATLASIAIEPIGASVPVAGKLQYHATGLFSDGNKQDLTGQVQWASGNAAVLSIVSGGATTGLATGVATGTTTVSASLLGVAGQTAVTVTPATLTSVEVAPAQVTLAAGVGTTFVATGIYSDGTTLDVTSTATWASSAPTVLSVGTTAGAQGQAMALKAGTAVVTATVGDKEGMSIVTVTPATLKTVSVAPATASIPKGTTQAFTAQGTYSDGAVVDITASAVWSVADVAVASVSNAADSHGVATGLAEGTTHVVATLAGVAGQGSLTVTAAVLVSLAVAPATVTLPLGRTQALKATATYSDQSTQDVTNQATWTSADATIAGVTTAGTGAGVVSALKVGGPVQITAALGGKMAAAAVTVTNAALDTITVTPATASAIAGTLVTFTASGAYSDGSTLDITRQVVWSSDSAAVATVANAAGIQGVATAVGPGMTTIHARLSGVDGTAALTVTQPAVTTITVQPINPSLHLGQTAQFSATAILSNGSGRNVTGASMWTSSAPTVATVSRTGAARCLAVGTTTITATYQTLTDKSTLTCTAAVVTAIQVVPFTASILVGQVQQFQAVAVYSDGTTQTLPGGQATWTSSNTAVAAIANGGRFGGGGAGSATGVSAGTVTITGQFMGFSATATLTVTQAVLTSLSVTPIVSTLHVGQTQAFTATGIYSDGSTRNLTAQSTWSTSDATIFDVTNGGGGGRGVGTALAPGMVTVTAGIMGFKGTASVTVLDATLMQIQVTPADAVLPVGFQQAFTAIGVYSDLSLRTLTTLVTWASSDATVAGVSNAAASKGLTTTLKAGTTRISATLGAVSGSAPLTVSTATVSHLQLTPVSPSTPAGVGVSFVATAVLSDLTTLDVTALTTFTSSDATVVSVSNAVASRGRATALKAGSATITAAFSGLSTMTTYTVGAQTLTSIVVSPATGAVAVGASQQLTATGHYSDGSTFDLTTYATWLSSATDKLVVSNAPGSQGLVTAVGAGTATIEADLQGQQGTATLMATP